MPIGIIQKVSEGYSPNEKIKIDYVGHKAAMRINVAEFEDHGHIVTYIPSLDLSAYGETKEASLKMLFEEVIDDFFENIFKLPEAEVTKELAKYGWVRGRILRKNFSNNVFVDEKGILRNFNLPAETPIRINTMATA